MKTLSSFLFVVYLLFSGSSFAQAFDVKSVPNPRTTNGGFISDPGNFLSDAERSRLNSELIDLEKAATAEFAIVILPSIGQANPKEFAVELFNYWGIGKKGKDNGLLLLLVMDQRRWEFETGYGLEGTLPDAILKRIGEDELVPNLKKKDYNAGFANVISAVTKKIKNEPETVTPYIPPTTPVEEQTQIETENYKIPFFQNLIFYFLAYFHYIIPIYAILFFGGVYYLKNRQGKKVPFYFQKILSIGS